MRNRILARVSAVFTCSLIAAAVFSSNAHAAASTCTANAAEQAFMTRLYNARTNKGLRALTFDGNLLAVSRRHTSEMGSVNLLVHTASATLQKRVTGWKSLGENIAVIRNGASLTDANKASTAYNMFYNSTVHRENMFRSSFRHHGIAFRTMGVDVWVTHTFTSEFNPSTSLTANVC